MYLTDQQIEDLLRKVVPDRGHPTIGSDALKAIQVVRAAAAEHADSMRRHRLGLAAAGPLLPQEWRQ